MREIGIAPVFLLLVAVLLFLVSTFGLGGFSLDQNGTDPTPVSELTPADIQVDRADPSSDQLGWEDGYWANEDLEITTEDGLNASERTRIGARTMARVEVIRQLEFNESVPIEVKSRSAFRNETANTENVSWEDRLHQNAKFEALFMVNESSDALGNLQGNRGSSVGGFYRQTNDSIVIIYEGDGVSSISERTLAHELVHALQDQHFDLDNVSRRTEEENNAVSGLIEGDANFVDYRYSQYCQDVWANTCLSATQSQSNDGGDIHFGIFALRFQPYSDGPTFVRSFEQEGGWERVNELYESPPESTEQTIHPERYPNDTPQNVTIQDRSNSNWNVLDLPGDSINYAEFGEAGIYSMFLYPALDSGGQHAVITRSSFLNRNSEFDPYNYDHRYSAGWDGDKLLPYVQSDSRETNETGYVWKLTWDTNEDAEEFTTAYTQLLRIHDARKVPDRTGVWRIEEGGFEDAFRIDRQGKTVTIVNAPRISALSGVHARPTR